VAIAQLVAYTKWASPFFACGVATQLFTNDFGEDL